VKRRVAQELTLSFVPDAEQRLWRTVMRRKYQVTRNRVQLQNRLEALLEEAHIKLSSLVSDLLGISARRMLQALADGETDPATLAGPRCPAAPRDTAATVRRLQRLPDPASGLPTAGEARARGTPRHHRSPRPA
jgi:transposase